MSEAIIAEAEKLSPWYHEMELAPGYLTRSVMLESKPSWDNIRDVRVALSYRGKSVLEVGAMDGMWAFEAEKLGAKRVVATDVWQNSDRERVPARFNLARRAYQSNVILAEADIECGPPNETLRTLQWVPVDIVQCLGVLYHLKNPMRALANLRSCLRMGGMLLLETALWMDVGVPAMRFNSDQGIYCDDFTFWAPNADCLEGMLKVSRFWVVPGSIRIVGTGDIRRICLLAEGV